MANWAQAGLARSSLAYTCVLANWARAGVANPFLAYEYEHKPLFVKLRGEEHQFHSIRSAQYQIKQCSINSNREATRLLLNLLLVPPKPRHSSISCLLCFELRSSEIFFELRWNCSRWTFLNDFSYFRRQADTAKILKCTYS